MSQAAQHSDSPSRRRWPSAADQPAVGHAADHRIDHADQVAGRRPGRGDANEGRGSARLDDRYPHHADQPSGARAEVHLT